MDISFVVALLIFFLLTLLSFVWTRRFIQFGGLPPHARNRLPPGSMGLPFLGETLKLFSQNPNQFFTTKQSRYGEMFKTHILGCPCIMLANPDAARFVLVTKASLFKPTYPKSKERLIGSSAIFYQQGGRHTQIRKLVQASLSLDTIKGLISPVESIVTSALDSWSGGHVVHTFHELKKLAFEVAVLSIFGELDKCYKEELKKNYYILDNGYNSFPFLIPGTRYYRSFLARKVLSRLLGEIIKERKEKRLQQKNLLELMLSFRSGAQGQVMSDKEVMDNVIGVLFAAQDTTASLLTWILKFITDDINILHSIKEEHRVIYEANGNGSQPLTWAQIKTMSFTNKVIQESQRMASIISFTYREATEDVDYNGCLIPKGWKVLPLFRNIHHSPIFYKDAERFNPSRFEHGMKAQTFMPFGMGVHSCPGNELAKLQILVFIHHLVNKFRWELVVGSNDGGGVTYSPFPVPEEGLPARFWKSSASSSIQHVINFGYFHKLAN